MIKKLLTGIFDLLLLALVIIIAALSVRAAWFHFYKAAYPMKYSDAVFEQSRVTGVSPSLLFAVIRTESDFNPNALSSVPARGLMQITSDTFDWIAYRIGESGKYDYDDMFDGETNIRYGAELLRLLLAEFKSDNNALCAYHAGRGNVLKWLENPEYSDDGEVLSIPFNDTRRHVKKALEAKRIYEELYNLNPDSYVE